MQSTPQRWNFLKHFIKNPLEVGAIAPSSRKLAHVMLKDLHLKPGDPVMELGPGTGAFTLHIRRMLPDARAYVGIECEPRFVRHLQSNFPDMHFVTGRAEHALQLHREIGLAPLRVIISGIPFANLWGNVMQNTIINTLDNLMSPGCIFRTFQYVHSFTLPPAVRFRGEMNDRFGEYLRSPVVLQNLPPAFVLTWRR